MANEEPNNRESFLARYKNLTVVGGGGPAMVLAIGTPIAVMLAIAIVFGNVSGLWALGGVLAGVFAYGVLIWLIVGLAQRGSQPPTSGTTTGS